MTYETRGLLLCISSVAAWDDGRQPSLPSAAPPPALFSSPPLPDAEVRGQWSSPLELGNPQKAHVRTESLFGLSPCAEKELCLCLSEAVQREEAEIKSGLEPCRTAAPARRKRLLLTLLLVSIRTSLPLFVCMCVFIYVCIL